ncbi:hypothetical protein [Nannocystis pusilla]|uniref:hypothetical protein n=1 Tax=Nannocystis pusilla TaxID=889268 RepID=UPI003B805D0C
MTTALWRNRLARVLCEFPAASAWAEAEELVAPMLAHTGGIMHFRVLAQGIVARVSLLRGQPGDAEAHARAAMAVFSDMPLWLLHTASVHVRALLALGRADEAVEVAERVLAVIPGLGGAGHPEVELRLAASEAFHAAAHVERARAELRETLRQIDLRADDIADPSWRHSYLSRNPYCLRARALADAWGVS